MRSAQDSRRGTGSRGRPRNRASCRLPVGELLGFELRLADGSDDVGGRVLGRLGCSGEVAGGDPHDGVVVRELAEDLRQLGADAVTVDPELGGTLSQSVLVLPHTPYGTGLTLRSLRRVL